MKDRSWTLASQFEDDDEAVVEFYKKNPNKPKVGGKPIAIHSFFSKAGKENTNGANKGVEKGKAVKKEVDLPEKEVKKEIAKRKSRDESVEEKREIKKPKKSKAASSEEEEEAKPEKKKPRKSKAASEESDFVMKEEEVDEDDLHSIHSDGVKEEDEDEELREDDLESEVEEDIGEPFSNTCAPLMLKLCAEVSKPAKKNPGWGKKATAAKKVPVKLLVC
jgi:hypothetical protein